MDFSIIIPTFNRKDVLARSIDSTMQFVQATGSAEVIVVDDASQDGSGDMVAGRYRDEIERGVVKLVRRSCNGGVTAARNDAARVATGDRLICLDSDDRLLPAAAVAIPAFAAGHPAAPILFFRCEDEAGRLVGPPQPPGPLDLAALLGAGTPGECLPVVSRTAFLAHPYDADLRGFEHLAYLRIVRDRGPAMLSDAVVRSYSTAGADRLSTRAAQLRRAGLMARGFARVLREFGHLMPPGRRLGLALRVAVYGLAATIGFGR